MTEHDGLVERLRNGGIEGGSHWKLFQEAADEIARLREALEPFAAMAAHLDDTAKVRDGLYCGSQVNETGVLAQVKASDYHRARTALSSEHPTTGGRSESE